MSVRKTKVIKQFNSTWTFEVSSTDDKVTSRLAYKDDFAGFASRVPLLGSQHPDIPGLVLVKVNCAREDGEQVAVDLTYESSSWETEYPGRPPRDSALVTTWCDIQMREEPLLSHPKIQDLMGDEINALRQYADSPRTKQDYETAYAALAGTADGIQALNALRRGQESVLVPNIVWVQKRVIKNLSEVPWGKIGTIDDPPNGAPMEDGRDYLYLSPTVSPTDDREFYELEERWQRSDPGGWNPLFYSAT